MSDGELLYRYGPVGYVWRALGALALVGAGSLLVVAVQHAALAPVFVALPLLAPVVVLFPMVATRITVTDLRAETRDPREAAASEDVQLEVRTLAGLTRRFTHDRIRGRRMREYAEGDVSRIYAPRAWILLHGAWPVYVDLLAHIPDKKRFAATFGLPASRMPR